MPKRPCAIAVTHNNATILCADKFGDVYALPLLGNAFQVPESMGREGSKNAEDRKRAEHKPFIPTANALTVHTKRNRNALLQQQNSRGQRPQKKLVAFDHQLILGHVSLLTDIACASLTGADGVAREYIVTSDRDEHIRVSRGLPQAYIIEGFCLGHTSFISKLCFPSSDPRLLVSGGGDDHIVLWDWPTGSLVDRLNMKQKFDLFREVYNDDEAQGSHTSTQSAVCASISEREHIAVSNIVYSSDATDENDMDLGRLFITLEE